MDAIAKQLQRSLLQDNFSLLQSYPKVVPPRQPEGPMRLVAYTRLSQSNAHEDESHEAQLARINAWAESRGDEVVAHHKETISGLVKEDANRRAIEDLEAHLRERVALADALNDLVDADGLVVDVRDRLARDPLVSELILRDVWRADKVVFSALQGDLGADPGDPTQELLRTVVGAADRYVGQMTKLRMARGRQRAVERGRLIGPAPAFGWSKDPDDPGRPVPDPETYPLVEQAVRQRREGATLRDVAAWLAQETGERWHATQVKRLCERYERYARAEVER